MNFSQAIKSSLIEKYATFKGRACRAEWWYFNLFIILVAIAVSAVVAFATFGSVDWEYVATLNETQATEFILVTNFGTATKLTSVILALIFFIPSMSVTIRRLQDLDASYYWVAPYFLANLTGIWMALFPSIEPSAVRLDAAGNLIFIIYCLAFLRPGGYEDNRFGPNPLEEDTY